MLHPRKPLAWHLSLRAKRFKGAVLDWHYSVMITQGLQVAAEHLSTAFQLLPQGGWRAETALKSIVTL
jgi:hypothetical protein